MTFAGGHRLGRWSIRYRFGRAARMVCARSRDRGRTPMLVAVNGVLLASLLDVGVGVIYNFALGFLLATAAFLNRCGTVASS
jgi:hypothetical protein